MLPNIKISVITVVRNGEKHIEQTINSILEQSYSNIEYIIIDGNSSDNTLSIIKKYESKIAYFTSEPDSGIYDGMNKGIKAATGDWILFINSDDYLLDNSVIEKSVPYLLNTTNLVAYGKMIYILPSGQELVIGDDWSKIKDVFRNFTMGSVSHQSTFHAKQLFRYDLYDTNYQLAGDYDFLLKHLEGNDATFIPVEISKMRNGGSSAQNFKALFLENCKIHWTKRNYRFFTSRYFLKYTFTTYSHHWSNKLFGPNLGQRLKDRINYRKRL